MYLILAYACKNIDIFAFQSFEQKQLVCNLQAPRFVDVDSGIS
jgi:hypothetical protein